MAHLRHEASCTTGSRAAAFAGPALRPSIHPSGRQVESQRRASQAKSQPRPRKPPSAAAPKKKTQPHKKEKHRRCKKKKPTNAKETPVVVGAEEKKNTKNKEQHMRIYVHRGVKKKQVSSLDRVTGGCATIKKRWLIILSTPICVIDGGSLGS